MTLQGERRLVAVEEGLRPRRAADANRLRLTLAALILKKAHSCIEYEHYTECKFME